MRNAQSVCFPPTLPQGAQARPWPPAPPRPAPWDVSWLLLGVDQATQLAIKIESVSGRLKYNAPSSMQNVLMGMMGKA